PPEGRGLGFRALDEEVVPRGRAVDLLSRGRSAPLRPCARRREECGQRPSEEKREQPARAGARLLGSSQTRKGLHRGSGAAPQYSPAATALNHSCGSPATVHSTNAVP